MRFTVWDPFGERDALLRALHSPFRVYPTQNRTSYPPVEMVDKGDSIVVVAQAPGLNKDEVELTVLGNTLTITGEKKLAAEKDVNYIRHERPHGKFRRLIDTPYSVDRDKISASYTDGILTIVLPKAEEAKPKKVVVQ